MGPLFFSTQKMIFLLNLPTDGVGVSVSVLFVCVLSPLVILTHISQYIFTNRVLINI